MSIFKIVIFDDCVDVVLGGFPHEWRRFGPYERIKWDLCNSVHFSLHFCVNRNYCLSVSIVLSSLLLVRYAPPRLLDEIILAGMGSGGSARAKSGELSYYVVQNVPLFNVTACLGVSDLCSCACLHFS